MAKLKKLKETRDNAAVEKALANVRKVARSEENIMPCLIEAVKTYATLGEICGVLREEFGEYHQDHPAF